MSGERAKSAGTTDSESAGRQRRTARTQQLPAPVEDRTLDYAACRPELKGIEHGEVVLAIEELEGFHHIVRPALAEIDRRRRAPRPGESKRRGRSPSFHAIDYWRLELLRRVIGEHSTQDTRNWLTTDKARRTRELLGFDQPRTHHGGKARKWMAGIPSDGWMSDFRTKWLPEGKLAELLQTLEHWGLAEKLVTLPGMAEECRLLYADGSKLETHATPPKYKGTGKNRKLTNATRKNRKGETVRGYTAPDAGFVPTRQGVERRPCRRWLEHRLLDQQPRHRPRAPQHPTAPQRVGRARGPGRRAARDARLARHPRDARPHRRRRVPRPAGAPAPARAGVIENIHLSSHGRHASAKKSVAARNDKEIPIEGHEWHTNGHRELSCNCGTGKTARVIELDRKGKAIVRTKGECRTCGTITLTSGWWRRGQNTDRWVKCLSKDRDKASWEVGNPLTYNDEQAESYGVPRYNSQEGLFGSQFTQRFNLLRGKRWFYRQSQVDLEVAAVVTITHALSLERHRRMQTAADQSVVSVRAGSAPPLALAA